MKISVIVPVYKVEKYLKRCVDSILNQTFKDFELILVDDGSPDNCPIICDAYATRDNRIKVIHQHNQGQSVARNVGIEYSMATNSEWITFIDSDDWVHPQYLEILYNVVIKYKLDIVSCNYIFTKDIEIVATSTKFDNVEIIKDKTEKLFINGMNTYAPWGRLCKKTCFYNVRFPLCKWAEDMRTMYKVLYNGKTAYVKNILYYYFYNNDGLSFSKYSLEEYLEKNIEEVNAHKEYLMFVFNNGNYVAAKKMFDEYSIIVKKFVKKFNKEDTEKIYENFCNVKKLIFSNKKYIYVVNKLEKESKIENLKNDFNMVKKEKNVWFAIFFYCRNLFKIYLGDKIK